MPEQASQHEGHITLTKGFRLQDGRYFPYTMMEGSQVDSLPPAMYTINSHPEYGFFASKLADDTPLPKTVYKTGYEDVIEGILYNYETTDKASGAIFTGPAGVGKSVASQTIQYHFIKELKKPVFLISNSFTGQGFKDFVNDLGEGLFIFDEFEKVYHDHKDGLQDDLLSMFDGSDSKQKRLALIIVNEYDKLSDYYKGRAGRCRYVVEWSTLSPEFIRSYLESELKSVKFKDDILEWTDSADLVTFDNLEAVVQECNRFPATEFDALLKYLNLNYKDNSQYLLINGASIDGIDITGSLNPTELLLKFPSPRSSLEIPVIYNKEQADNFKEGKYFHSSYREFYFSDLLYTQNGTTIVSYDNGDIELSVSILPKDDYQNRIEKAKDLPVKYVNLTIENENLDTKDAIIYIVDVLGVERLVAADYVRYSAINNIPVEKVEQVQKSLAEKGIETSLE